MESLTANPHMSWIKRRAAWVIGIGALLLFAALMTGVYVTAGTLFHDSDAFHMAVSAATANPAVQAQVGTPIETGRFVSGNMQVTDTTGHAEFSIPISGPKGRGKLYVVAHKTAGSWRMSVLEFIAEGNQSAVDILPGAPPVSVK